MRSRHHPTWTTSRVVAALVVDHVAGWCPPRGCSCIVRSPSGVVTTTTTTRHIIPTASAGTTAAPAPSLVHIFLGLDRVRQVALLVALVVVRLVLASNTTLEVVLGDAGAGLVVRVNS